MDFLVKDRIKSKTNILRIRIPGYMTILLSYVQELISEVNEALIYQDPNNKKKLSEWKKHLDEILKHMYVIFYHFSFVTDSDRPVLSEELKDYMKLEIKDDNILEHSRSKHE
jgi:hypothetical protein